MKSPYIPAVGQIVLYRQPRTVVGSSIVPGIIVKTRMHTALPGETAPTGELVVDDTVDIVVFTTHGHFHHNMVKYAFNNQLESWFWPEERQNRPLPEIDEDVKDATPGELGQDPLEVSEGQVLTDGS